MRIRIKPEIAVCTTCSAGLIVDGTDLKCESGHELSLEGWGGKMGRMIKNWTKWKAKHERHATRSRKAHPDNGAVEAVDTPV